MARTKIHTVEVARGWGRRELARDNSDPMLTNLIVSIKDFELFIKIMGKEEI